MPFQAAVAERLRAWTTPPAEADFGTEISIAKQWVRDGLAEREVLALIESAPLLQQVERPSLRIWHDRQHRDRLQVALGMVRKRLEAEDAKSRASRRGNDLGDLAARIAR